MSLPHQGSIKFYGKSIFPVFISYIYNFFITKIGLSNSSVSVLRLTVFCIYTRLQKHVSVPGEVGIYVHIGVQVDTDN